MECCSLYSAVYDHLQYGLGLFLIHFSRLLLITLSTFSLCYCMIQSCMVGEYTSTLHVLCQVTQQDSFEMVSVGQLWYCLSEFLLEGWDIM